jgi:triosephosphate isomerase
VSWKDRNLPRFSILGHNIYIGVIMRKIIIAGNWKMNTERESGVALARAVAEGLGGITLLESMEVVLCPPFVLVPLVGDAIAGTRAQLGAQDVHDKPKGAYTGEVSAGMLKSMGCAYVIVGHSERRMMFAESDGDVSLKTNAVLDAGMRPIICVGETSAERGTGRQQEVVRRQLHAALDGVLEFNVRNCVIAYEPIWAIGTGDAATPEQAQEMHQFIRGVLHELYNEAAANDISIIYGGSINASNAAELFAQADVDGGLVGGASLDADGFLTIVRSVG